MKLGLKYKSKHDFVKNENEIFLERGIIKHKTTKEHCKHLSIRT